MGIKVGSGKARQVPPLGLLDILMLIIIVNKKKKKSVPDSNIEKRVFLIS